jgi:hypothetical protein
MRYVILDFLPGLLGNCKVESGAVMALARGLLAVTAGLCLAAALVSAWPGSASG